MIYKWSKKDRSKTMIEMYGKKIRQGAGEVGYRGWGREGGGEGLYN